MSLAPDERYMDGGFQHGSISPDILQKAFTQALRDFFPALKRNQDPRAEFYACYQRVSAEYDRDFIKKYDEDLNTTLIFAGLFSGVASAFILDAQTNLQENYNQTSAALLRILIQKIDNPTTTGTDLVLPEWPGPSSVIVQVQCVLYSSLAASLLAAFVAMLGKQWLNRYERVTNRGSSIERSRDRQMKYDGLVTWRFHLVMEGLPLMLQVAVLLLGYAVSRYLWTIDITVASVVIGISAMGVLFYSFMVMSGVISYNCPFQTPVSLVLRSLIYYNGKRRLFHLIPSRLFSIFQSLRKRVTLRPSWSRTTSQRDIELGTSVSVQEVVMEGDGKVEPIFDSKPSGPDRTPDVRCAAWLLKTSTEADVTLAAVRVALEVESHSETKTMPSLVRLYDALSECFDSTDDYLTPEMKNKAYTAAKVFIRIYTRKCCLDHQDVIFRELSLRAGPIPPCSPDDADLYSILGMVREIVHGRAEWPCYSNIPFSISLSHLSWIAHILLCRVWQSRRSMQFPDEIYDFMRRALSFPTHGNPRSLEPLIADCLMILGVTIGLPVDADDLLIANKSEKMDVIIDRLYEQLNKSFRKSTSKQEMDRLLAVLRMMSIDAMADRLAVWSSRALTNELTTSGGLIHPQERLFRTIMDPSRRDTDIWPAARLALQHIFRNGEFYPYFKDSTILVAFLQHHFYLEGTGEQHSGPIAAALEAFSSPLLHLPTGFETSQGTLFEGMRESLKCDKPIRVRLNALFYFEWIGRHDFNVPGAAMSSLQRSEFCSDLAIVWNRLPPDSSFVICYSTILLRMVNSHIWRSHLLLDQWKSLEFLSTSSTHLEPLDQCLLDETLIPSLSQMTDCDEIIKSWLKVVWRQPFETMPPHMIGQVRAATLAVFRREGEATMEEFGALVDLDQKGLGTLMYVAPEINDTAHVEGMRRRGSIFQELCDEAQRMLDGDIVDSPISL